MVALLLLIAIAQTVGSCQSSGRLLSRNKGQDFNDSFYQVLDGSWRISSTNHSANGVLRVATSS